MKYNLGFLLFSACLICLITSCGDSREEIRVKNYALHNDSNKTAIENFIKKYHAYNISSPPGQGIKFTYGYQRELIDKKIPLGIVHGLIKDIVNYDSVCVIKILTDNFNRNYISATITQTLVKTLIDSIKSGNDVSFIINISRIESNDYAFYTDNDDSNPPLYLFYGNVIDFLITKD